ncbi:hypothetical protein M0804_004543 [Polistes exclamans]|nr:hypothetical protein M0804_004543 [Polistes exclamans]
MQITPNAKSLTREEERLSPSLNENVQIYEQWQRRILCLTSPFRGFRFWNYGLPTELPLAVLDLEEKWTITPTSRSKQEIREAGRKRGMRHSTLSRGCYEVAVGKSPPRREGHVPNNQILPRDEMHPMRLARCTMPNYYCISRQSDGGDPTKTRTKKYFNPCYRE